MNVYVVVEGRVVEKEVYRVWIPKVNPTLTHVQFLPQVQENNFYVVSGDGYPQYFETIRDALANVASSETFDRLVICIDSEEMTFEAKRDEVVAFINEETPYADVNYRVVVQHFCFETWALGNRVIGGKNVQDERLRRYRRFYNVQKRDPEDLPAFADEKLTRVEFAERYLRATLNNKYKNLSYSKHDPDVVAHPGYFEQLRNRLNDTQHIKSFQAFLDAFV